MQARILHQAVAALTTGACQCGRSSAFGTPDIGSTLHALATYSGHAAERVRRTAWLPAVAVASSLAGCQLFVATLPEPDLTPASAGLTPAPAAKTKTPRPPGEHRAQVEAKLAGKPIRESDDLLVQLRAALSLRVAEEPSVQLELDWYRTHPDYLERVFTRADPYLYYIVEELERREMPVDLALLPVVESAFDPFAYSHGRAAGLWQIIPSTGTYLGLTQNWWYDARRDVVDSTRGALDYLEHLHRRFDRDWLLAVAGYNSGEGNVVRAIARAQAAGEPTDFWHIRPYLPVETRTYVPRLLAIRALVGDPAASAVTLPSLPNEPHFNVVATDGQIDMALAAELADITTAQLYELNPGVNRWATDPEGPHRLLVPVDRAAQLTEALAALGDRERVKWSRHEVQSGETLGLLAQRYQTTTPVLRDVNGLRSHIILIGQQIMIPHAVTDRSAYTHTVDARLERQQNQTRGGQRQTHEVRPGDSLWLIATNYGVGIRELAGWNGMAPGDLLSIGRQLVIWSDQRSVLPASNSRIRRVMYIVRQGDSLALISTRFHVSVAELLQWNQLSADRYLQPGQRLLLYVDVTEQST